VEESHYHSTGEECPDPLCRPGAVEAKAAPLPKNSGIPLAEEFLAYCKANPHLRFWQALLAWTGLNKLCEVTFRKDCGKDVQVDVKDTFYWGGKNEGGR
jgi:hypothetical protein